MTSPAPPATDSAVPGAAVRAPSVFDSTDGLWPAELPTRVPTPAEMQLITELARGLHRYGAPAHRLERMIEGVARRLGYELNALCTPTSVTLAFGPLDRQVMRLIRVHPGVVDLSRLSRLYTLADDIVSRRLSDDMGMARIHAIDDHEDAVAPFFRVLCHGISSAAAAIFFQCGPGEVTAATGIGILVGTSVQWGRRSQRVLGIIDAFAAALAVVLASAWSNRVQPIAVFETTLSGIISLLPGFTLTIAMTELATRNLVSGTARLASAGLTFLQLAVGVTLGTQVAVALGFTPGLGPLEEPVVWLLPLAVLTGAGAIALLYHARPRDLPLIVAAGTLGYATARIGADALGPGTGAFVGALLVGVLGNLYGRFMRQPSLVVTAPALTLLVPGSVGFRGISAFMQNDTLAGIDTLVTMFTVAASLVAGLLTANVLVRPPASE